MRAPGFRCRVKPPLGSRPDPSSAFGNPALFFLFNEGSGLTVYDRSPNASPATAPNGFAWAASGDGVAASLVNTSSQYFQVLNAVCPACNMGSATDFSLWARIQHTASQANFTGLIAKADATTGMGCQLLINNSNKGYVELNDGSVLNTIAGEKLLNDGVVHDVVLTVSRAAHLASLYVDGLLDGSVTGPNLSDNFDCTAPLLIGVERTLGVRYTGRMILAAVYRQCFTAGQIASLHADPYQMFLPPNARRWGNARNASRSFLAFPLIAYPGLAIGVGAD